MKDECSIDGCVKAACNGRGWCRRHYRLWNTYGDPLVSVYTPGKLCAVPTCDIVCNKYDLCRLHLARMVAHGDPLYTPPERAMTCSVPGCKKAVGGRGWCPMHYQRWRDCGDPLRQPRGQAGVNNNGWRGNFAGYGAQHARVSKAKGRAAAYVCACGKQAQDWSYTHGCYDERFRDDSPYCLHIEHYVARCKPCHKRYDVPEERQLPITMNLLHTRWHVDRGVTESGCALCV